MNSDDKVSAKFDQKDLARRALAAWFKSGAIEQPTGPELVETTDGKTYVALYNTNGILAVYRVRNDGMLKGLKRYPKEIAEMCFG
ncbi:MAG: hypothetical protein ACXW2U_05310 [Telluria sp.]